METKDRIFLQPCMKEKGKQERGTTVDCFDQFRIANTGDHFLFLYIIFIVLFKQNAWLLLFSFLLWLIS